jgi:lipoyl(octanoyl) transferase
MANSLQATAPTREASAHAATRAAFPSVEWMVTHDPVPYEAAGAAMTERVAGIIAGSAPELVWLLEHPPLYTAGTSAKPEDLVADLVAPMRLPVHRTGRGGQYTYHGPGQRVAYVMLDVKRRFGDVRAYVAALEDWIIDTLAAFDVQGERWPGRVGVWVCSSRVSPLAEAGVSPLATNVAIRHADAREGSDPVNRDGSDPGGAQPRAKIAAIGVRLSRWVSSHGIALNVDPDLAHYAGIVPCGIRDAGVTSLAALGRSVSLDEVDGALRVAFERRFGAATADAAAAATAASRPDR